MKIKSQFHYNWVSFVTNSCVMEFTLMALTFTNDLTRISMVEEHFCKTTLERSWISYRIRIQSDISEFLLWNNLQYFLVAILFKIRGCKDYVLRDQFVLENKGSNLKFFLSTSHNRVDRRTHGHYLLSFLLAFFNVDGV